MEERRNVNLPIAFRVQHGEQQIINGKQRAVELEHFIAKTKNKNLQFLVNRFNEKYKDAKTITIKVIDENPFKVRRARYNQGGTVCYHMKNQDTNLAKQKISNVWKEVECNAECPHRIVAEGAIKATCNEEGTLRFMLPEICKDMICYMLVTGGESIRNLEGYFNFQKEIGNSVIGEYNITLVQKEQNTKKGKKYKNYILEIVKVEDKANSLVPENANSTNIQAKENIIATKEKSNTTNSTLKEEQAEKTYEKTKETENTQKEEVKTVEKKTTKRASKSKKTENVKQEQMTMEVQNTKVENAEIQNTESQDELFARSHFLVETSTTTLMKNGEPKEYLVANFVNAQDKQIDVIIPHELESELLECDVGTAVILDLQTAGDKTFTNSIKYVQKCLKDVAA